MPKRLYENQQAEAEANDVAFRFMNSSDVMSDMEQEFHTSFSNVSIHTDEAADDRVKEAGRDAIASGNDIFFGKGILESHSPESKGLMAHELTHVMQQSGDAADFGLSESVSYGAEEGGLLSWFRGWWNRRKTKKSEERVNARLQQNVAANADPDYSNVLSEAAAMAPFGDDIEQMPITNFTDDHKMPYVLSGQEMLDRTPKYIQEPSGEDEKMNMLNNVADLAGSDKDIDAMPVGNFAYDRDMFEKYVEPKQVAKPKKKSSSKKKKTKLKGRTINGQYYPTEEELRKIGIFW